MEFGRFLTTFIVGSVILIFFFFLFFKILKAGRKKESPKLSFILSGFYISIIVAAVLNMVYALLFIESVVLILNFFTNFFVAFAPSFLVVFNLVLYKKERMNNTKIALFLFGYAFILLLKAIFIPFGGLKINESTDWKPVWGLNYYIYVVCVSTIFCIIPLIILSCLNYRDIQDNMIRKKFRFYIIGSLLLFIYMYGAFTINLEVFQAYRLIFSLFSILIIFAMYLVYFGLIKNL